MGKGISEYSFAEKPTITKTEVNDYDRWAYSGLEVNVPSIRDLGRGEFTDNNIDIAFKVGAYLVDTIQFTARTSGNETGALAVSDFDSASTTTKRTLRYSSSLTDGNISVSYVGVLAKVYYESSEKAIVAEFTGVPSTLEGTKDHPQTILLNGVRYDFQYWNNESGTLKAYHYIEINPFTAGEDYNLKIPKAQIITSTGSEQVVQLANEDNFKHRNKT